MKLVLDVGQQDEGYKEYLDKQLGAVGARIAMLRGQGFTFDEESQPIILGAGTWAASRSRVTTRTFPEQNRVHRSLYDPEVN